MLLHSGIGGVCRARTQVEFPAWQWVKGSGVATQLQRRSQLCLESVPGLGIPYVVGWPEKKKLTYLECLWWFSRLKPNNSVAEHVGSISGITQWVKDPVLPQAAALVTHGAWIQCCCGVGLRLQLPLNP